MSVQSVALTSLAVAYSDSEAEDDVDVDDEANTVPSQAAAPHNNQVGQPQGIVSPIFANSASNSPTIPQTNSLTAPVVNATLKNVQQLVSYDPDDSFVHHEEVTVIPDENFPNTEKKIQLLSHDESMLDDLIPPEPEGKYPPELQEKIAAFHIKMETDGLDLNGVIENRKDFKNPSIYSKLVSFCEINELGTNYSLDYFDPFKWGQESYYEELGKTQDACMEKLSKKSKAKADGTTSATKRPVGPAGDDSRRKIGKWDQVTTVNTPTKSNIVTSSAMNDKKCKVIVAFGAVRKRRL
ncbi:SAP30-binding protein [Fopius arisanus]|uniref:SAP30-binding protein n=1 Tax=Fopius arisanus TaxID=64838 RepID=A0A9R1UB24_9HYME|nr:PREDICTED: SAP30-binding protein-like [Fopius arisanus]